jgi:ATP-binding protein involved in chromosome partitioning
MPRKLRSYAELTGTDRSDLLGQVLAQRERVRRRLAGVGRVVAVMSGKGGVGKSFVTAALATAYAAAGRAVGVVDADLYAPTAARMLGAPAGPLLVRDGAALPARTAGGVRVMSTDLLLAEAAPLAWKEPAHERHVWRGTLETGMLREFLGDVAWDSLDLLLVDLPPGTDRLTALLELVPELAGVLVVTIPSDASLRAVQRAVAAAREGGVPLLGIVENMAGAVCAACGSSAPLFSGDAARRLAQSTGAPLLASLPFDAAAQASADSGRMPLGGALGPAIDRLARALAARLERR